MVKKCKKNIKFQWEFVITFFGLLRIYELYDLKSVKIFQSDGKKGKQLALAFIYFRQNVHVRFAAMLCIPSFFHWKHDNTCNLQAYRSWGCHGTPNF